VRADLLGRLEELGHLGDVRLVVACPGDDLPAPSHGIPVIGWDAWIGAAAPAAIERLPRPSDVAALVFTSGTSGGSKAAAWSHHYLHLSSACVSDALEHTPADVLSTSLQMCHIAGLQNFANSALQVGCTAHLKSSFSASRYWEEIADDGATFSMLMGQMAAMILKEVPAAPPHRLERAYILPQPQEREEFERRYGTTVLWQGWGMTEIFPHPPSRDRLEGVTADTIGPPPAWVDFGVVDGHDRLLGPGELGELVYRPLMPYGMASGYFEEPEATARAFRNFMFHTGDLGYYDEAGNMHFVMRNQDAIRRHGENISAVELENIVLAHPNVVDGRPTRCRRRWGSTRSSSTSCSGRTSISAPCTRGSPSACRGTWSRNTWSSASRSPRRSASASRSTSWPSRASLARRCASSRRSAVARRRNALTRASTRRRSGSSSP
jgi:crotonobetaine/carnitine-CoA ligase